MKFEYPNTVEILLIEHGRQGRYIHICNKYVSPGGTNLPNNGSQKVMNS